ncbi:virion structural protein [Maribacter phage Panino]
MERIEELIERVEQTGNVMNFGRFSLMQDFDELVKCLDKQGKYAENLIFCSPMFYKAVKNMLDWTNAFIENQSHGRFDYVKDNAGMAYLVDLMFRRGTYEFYLIVKPMEGAVLCPVDCSEDSFTRNSIRVNLDV